MWCVHIINALYSDVQKVAKFVFLLFLYQSSGPAYLQACKPFTLSGILCVMGGTTFCLLALYQINKAAHLSIIINGVLDFVA